MPLSPGSGRSCQTFYGIDNAAPVATDTGVYFMSSGTGWRTYALDVASGKELWHATTPDTTSATAPAVSGGSLFFAAVRSNGVRLISLDVHTGAEQWNVRARPGSQQLFGPPVYAAGMVYIVLDEGAYRVAHCGSSSERASERLCEHVTLTLIEA
jgi:outer membrane protein assembly factor BamB